MEHPEDTLDASSEKLEESIPLEETAVLLTEGLRPNNVLFMGPVLDGYFQPASDKLHNPPRWETGNYSITAGKWPTPSLVPNLTDLTPYNGYVIMVMATEWDKEVISHAKIFGIMDNASGDVVTKFAYQHMQEKEEEIAGYITGLSN